MLANKPHRLGLLLQVRSLRQLILGSFFIALVPLIALLWQSQRDFDSVSQLTAKNTAFFVFMSSEMRELEALGDDLVRLVSQYPVLPKPQLQDLADAAMVDYTNKVAFLCDPIPDSNECRAIALNLSQLADYTNFNGSVLDKQLASLRETHRQLRRQLQVQINNRILAQQAYLEEIQSRQSWSTLVLAILSLGLTVIAAQLIIKPVRKLKDIIAAIASDENRLPKQSKNDPRELVAVEHDLYKLNDRLQQLEKVRTALLRHAAHELKTPMASIKEGCEILEQGVVGALTDTQSEVVSLLTASTDRLNLLIVKLLDYNALLQQAEPTFEQVDLHSLVTECCNDYKLLLSQNNQTILIRVEPTYKLVTDPELLRRALDNLVTNAIAHGNLDSEITVAASEIGDDAIIDVMNIGTPIPVASRAEMFEPFKRGYEKRNDKVTGAGLGLSIVSDCARLLGGDVAIVDNHYADVCFRIRLPRKDADV